MKPLSDFPAGANSHMHAARASAPLPDTIVEHASVAHASSRVEITALHRAAPLRLARPQPSPCHRSLEHRTHYGRHVGFAGQI
ncbi:unnamed protein product, partial [Pylaiella littoralis]